MSVMYQLLTQQQFTKIQTTLLSPIIVEIFKTSDLNEQKTISIITGKMLIIKSVIIASRPTIKLYFYA